MVSRSALSTRAGAAAAALVVDQLVGEPPGALHPVRWFGRIMRGVEKGLYADHRGRGSAHAALGVLLGGAAGGVVRRAGPAIWLAVAGRELGRTATAVGRALDAGQLERARELLPCLVGRDPSGLDEKDVARAVVESVAENTVDAVVAPVLWGALAGAPGALGYRAVNTLDAMVGHHSSRYERYGWASARLDDVAGWVPARVTAGLVALVRPARGNEVWRAVRDQAPRHPSPNAGVAEAAFAAALGLRLGGANRYGDRIELRPHLGRGRPPESADIERAVALAGDVTLMLAASLALARLVPRQQGRRSGAP